jgi:hypothetical protein
MLRHVVAIAAIASLVAVAAACTSSAPPSASPTTAAAASAPATASVPASAPASASQGPVASDPAALLYGTYTATIPSGVNAAPGNWRLLVAADAVSFTPPDGHSFSPGAVEEITATEIVLAPDPGCPTQSGTPTEGRYGWTREGDVLKLEVVSDSCRDRSDTLTSSEWSLNP